MCDQTGFRTVVIRVGCGRVHSFCDFVSGWPPRHGFKHGLVLMREVVNVVDRVGDRRFYYPLSLCASERSMACCSVATSTRNTFAETLSTRHAKSVTRLANTVLVTRP